MRVGSTSALVNHTDATQSIEFGSATADGSYRAGVSIRAYTAVVNSTTTTYNNNGTLSTVVTTNAAGPRLDIVASSVRTFGSMLVNGTLSSTSDLTVSGNAVFLQNMYIGTWFVSTGVVGAFCSTESVVTKS